MNSARHRQWMEDFEKSSREFAEAVQKPERQRIIYFVPFIGVSSFAVAALINYELGSSPKRSDVLKSSPNKSGVQSPSHTRLHNFGELNVFVPLSLFEFSSFF
ncbi:PREDICTED: uncharacterized protein LOC104737965 [Camelina sativa]|uniref:Uncharacterized protein LOC104737965 n=1 Tax=Camelina sativa TaxID=90675 RepID=A0ABM1QUC1_CAMSA|nr:PREDICTED: uncharacterized protein LOC104737965 [Camelina sativa]